MPIKGSQYRCIISRSSENEAINLMKKIDFIKTSRTL